MGKLREYACHIFKPKSSKKDCVNLVDILEKSCAKARSWSRVRSTYVATEVTTVAATKTAIKTARVQLTAFVSPRTSASGPSLPWSPPPSRDVLLLWEARCSRGGRTVTAAASKSIVSVMVQWNTVYYKDKQSTHVFSSTVTTASKARMQNWLCQMRLSYCRNRYCK